MLSLETGTYLGSLDKSICDNYIIACITSYSQASMQRAMHCHENPHISFVLHGGNLEKRKSGEIERLPGKITFYYSGEYHQSATIIDPSRHINLELQQQFLTEYGINENALAGAIATNPDAKFLLLHVYRELLVNDEMSAVSVRMLLLELFSHSLHSRQKQKDTIWISKIENILRDNWDGNLSLSFLSAALNMHPVTVSRLFHKYYSCTLGEYMRKLRLKKRSC